MNSIPVDDDGLLDDVVVNVPGAAAAAIVVVVALIVLTVITGRVGLGRALAAGAATIDLGLSQLESSHHSHQVLGINTFESKLMQLSVTFLLVTKLLLERNVSVPVSIPDSNHIFSSI